MQPSSRGEAGKSTCTSHGLWENKWEFIGLDWIALRWCLQTQLTLKASMISSWVKMRMLALWKGNLTKKLVSSSLVIEKISTCQLLKCSLLLWITGHNCNGEGWERNELTDYIGPKNDLWPPSSQTLTFEDKSMKLSKISIPIQSDICHQPNW